jgi:hypothetical protein
MAIRGRARWRRSIEPTIPMRSLSRIPKRKVLQERFGPRVIGLHISRSGEGMNPEWRPVKNGAMLVYTIGRTYLIELFHSEM